MKKKRIIKGSSLFIAVCVLITMLPISTYASVETEMTQENLIDHVLKEKSDGAPIKEDNLFKDYGIVQPENKNVPGTNIGARKERAGSGTYTTNQVVASLNSLLSQYPANSKWNRSFAGGTQCYAFAHFVFNSVFNRGNSQVGNGATSSNATCYKLNNIASDIRTIGTLSPGYSASSLEGLLESAAPGDYI